VSLKAFTLANKQFSDTVVQSRPQWAVDPIIIDQAKFDRIRTHPPLQHLIKVTEARVIKNTPRRREARFRSNTPLKSRAA
jgi:hypothetical protein